MALIKSLVAGLLAAAAGLVLALVGTVVLAVLGLGFAVTGSGGLGAISFGISPVGVLLTTVVGFVLGFRWVWRRQRRHAPGTPPDR